MIPELTPWGHTSGSKIPGKPLICSATWTRLNLLLLSKTGGKRARKGKGGTCTNTCSQKGVVMPGHLIKSWISGCGEMSREGQPAVKLSVKLCPSWVAVLGGRGGFCCALVRCQLHSALGAAGHRLTNHKHLFSLLSWVLCFIRETWNWPVTSKYLLSTSLALSIYLSFIFSAFLIVQLCFCQSVIPQGPWSHV